MLSTTSKSYDFGPFNKYESLIDEILNSEENSTKFESTKSDICIESDNFPKNAILFLDHINNKRNNEAKQLFKDHILNRSIGFVNDEELCFIVKSLCTITTNKQERIEFFKKLNNYTYHEIVPEILMDEYNEGTEEHFNYFKQFNDNFEKYKYCLKYPKLQNPYSCLISGLNNEEYLCFEELFRIEDCYILISIYQNIYEKNIKIPLLWKIRNYIPDFDVEEMKVNNSNEIKAINSNQIKDDGGLYFLIIFVILILIFK